LVPCHGFRGVFVYLDVKTVLQTWGEGYGVKLEAFLDELEVSLKDVKATDLVSSCNGFLITLTQCQQHKLDHLCRKETTDTFHQSNALLVSWISRDLVCNVRALSLGAIGYRFVDDPRGQKFDFSLNHAGCRFSQVIIILMNGRK